MEQLNKRQLQAQNTRDAIYAAVNALVEEMPFEDIRIQDVCERAGISLGSFYHYFSSKGDLMVDRYHRSNELIEKLFEEELTRLHAVDALKRYVSYLAEYNRTRLVKILRPYFVARIENAARWEEDEPPAGKKVLHQIVEDGMRRGEFDGRFTAEEIIRYVVCVSQGLTASQCMTYGRFLEDGAALAVVMASLEGLRSQAAPGRGGEADSNEEREGE